MALNKRWRRNPFDANTVNSVLITEEEHIIEFHEEPNAYGFYANEGILLDANDPVVLVQDNTAQTAFTEIPRTIAPSSGQFRVDYDEDGYYNTGFVQCNSSDNGKTVLFTYRGTGTLVHPTFRTLTDYNYAGNVNVEGNSTIDGSLTVGGAITFNGALNVGGSVSLAEDTGSTISANGKKIEDVADGTANTDAATFGQLENFRLSVAYLFGWVNVTASEQNDWAGVAASSTSWVVVGRPNLGSSAVARSTDDGVSWAGISVPEDSNTWEAVSYGNSVFVAVASVGTNRVMRSTNDGATWSAIAASAANGWCSVAYGNGVFVAVANSGTNRVMRSTNDGATWSGVASAAESNQWFGVTYGNGVFVAVAGSGTNRVMRSTDNGVSWSAIASADEGASWRSVTYGNGVFVAVADSGTNRIMVSTDDGATWSAKSAPAFTYSAVSYGNGNFVAVQSGSQLARSFDDGDSWAAVNLTTSQSYAAVHANGGTFISCAETGSATFIRNPGL